MGLTEKQKELFSYINTLIPEDGHLAYNLADPKQYEFACLMAEMDGETKRYPGRLETLAKIREKHLRSDSLSSDLLSQTGSWKNLFEIPSVGLSSTSQTVASNGFATVKGGYSNMNLTMLIQNNSTHDIVAHGFSNDFSGTLLPVSTQPAADGSTDTDVTSFMHYSYTGNTQQNVGESDLEMSAGVVKRSFKSGPIGDPKITAPARTTTAPLNPKAINIGLGRNWPDQGGSSQFDYAWNEPNQDHPIGKIPFVGHVTFGADIQAPLTPDSSIILNIYVADKSGGGGVQLAPADLDNVYKAFSIDPSNPKKLTWNLPAGTKTSDPGNPIVFSNVTWNSDMESYFYCGINVVMADGSLQFTAVQSLDSPDEDPTDGILEIMPIEFVWHCVEEGSLVKMADGTTKAIETILAGDAVFTLDGPANVLWVNKGTHQGMAIRIETGNGNSITTSENHVFITENGAKKASDLQEGEHILIDHSDNHEANIHVDRVEITAVTNQLPYSGMMYNLATREFQDPETHDGHIATFIANGFVVGDINAQRAIRIKNKKDFDYVKAHVPTYLHKDLESFFEDKKLLPANVFQ